jgi:hypothetical protein
VPSVAIAKPLAERGLELVTQIRGLQRLAIESRGVHRRADDNGVQTSIARQHVGTERLVAVPQAELGFDRQRLLPLASPGDQKFGLRMHAPRGGDLHTAAPIVIAEAFPRTYSRQARFGFRHLPLIIGSGEVVELAADVERSRLEQRPLEPERVADAGGRGPDRYVTGDVRVIEVLVVEDRRAESKRRDEAVDRREPVLAAAKPGTQPELPFRLAEADDENVASVAIDEIERASPLVPARRVAEASAARSDGAARAAQHRGERLHRARPVEHIARAQREFVGELCRHLRADTLKLDVVDDTFIDGHRERAGRRIQRGRRAREREAVFLVAPHDSLLDIGSGTGPRLPYLDGDRPPHGALGKLFCSDDANVANSTGRLSGSRRDVLRACGGGCTQRERGRECRESGH